MVKYSFLFNTHQLIEIRRPELNKSNTNKCILNPENITSPIPTSIKQTNIILTAVRTCELTPGSNIDCTISCNMLA